MTKTRTDKPELPAKYRWVLAVVLSAIIQFCIISYNYYTGLSVVSLPIAFYSGGYMEPFLLLLPPSFSFQ